MSVYCGIDLHQTNLYLFVGDEEDRPVVAERLPNELDRVLGTLEPYRDELVGIAVESTCNWYWLVDGLLDAEHAVHLANPAAMRRYEGLKFSGDRHDARWLAQLLRLNILPEGYIYPREQRAVRDLLRKRIRLVQKRTDHLRSLSNLIARNTGLSMTGDRLQRLAPKELEHFAGGDECRRLALEATREVAEAHREPIHRLEKVLRRHGRSKPEVRLLKTTPGIGDILALTIAYETGAVERFPTVGNYASYCRLVPTDWVSNERSKGRGNRKNGNPYLSWAYSQAATFARRYNARARRFYNRKLAATGPLVANRSLAHKLARACFFMMRDQEPFDAERLFG